MWCRNCNREAFDKTCDFCGSTTEQDMPSEIYWCSECQVPIIKFANELGKNICPLCFSATTYLSADLRPVFRREFLLEIIQNKPLAYSNKSFAC